MKCSPIQGQNYEIFPHGGIPYESAILKIMPSFSKQAMPICCGEEWLIGSTIGFCQAFDTVSASNINTTLILELVIAEWKKYAEFHCYDIYRAGQTI